MNAVEEIQEELKKLFLILSIPNSLFPSFKKPKDGGYPHVEVRNGNEYHYFAIERGSEIWHKVTLDKDELLYWICSDVTFSMSTKHELANRIKNKDCRRLIFSRQEELLSLLNPSWGKKARDEHAEILIRHPFDDNGSLRATYIGRWSFLRLFGVDVEKKAFEKYPPSMAHKN